MLNALASALSIPVETLIPALWLLGKATMLLLVALAITLVMQRTSAVSRHLVWFASLAALLVIPLIAALSPVTLPILPSVLQSSARARDLSTPVVPSNGSVPNVIDGVALGASAADDPTPAAGQISTVVSDAVGEPMRYGRLLLALWAVVAVALAGWLAAGQFLVARIVRRASVLNGPDWATPLYEIADRLALEDAPRLLRSADIAMPFACGFRSPTIVLPAGADDWSHEQRTAVLLHELAHIKRRDIVGHTLGRLACAVYWFHPLVWTAAKRLRAESERACDDLALLCGARPSDYAEHLLDIVARVKINTTPSLALAMATRSEFEGRMLAILDPALQRTAPSRKQAFSLVSSIVCVGAVIGLAVPATSVAATDAINASSTNATDVVATREDSHSPPPAGVSAPLATDSGDATQQDTTGRRVPAPAPAPSPSPRPTPSPLASKSPIAQPEPPETPSQPSAAVRPRNTATVAGLDILGLAIASAATNIADVSVRAAAKALGQVSITFDPMPTDTVARRERMNILTRVLRTDSSADVRRIAAWGLRDFAETPSTTTALLNALKGDASPEVRETAAWALSGAGPSRPVIGALVQAARDDRSVAVRVISTWALGTLGSEPTDAIVSTFSGGLSHSNAELREMAAWALGAVGPREAPRALLVALSDATDAVRLSAAWAVHQIGDQRAAAALGRALENEKGADVQMAQVRAMGRMGESGTRVLQRLLDHGSPEIRARALRLLTGEEPSSAWPKPRPKPRPHS